MVGEYPNDYDYSPILGRCDQILNLPDEIRNQVETYIQSKINATKTCEPYAVSALMYDLAIMTVLVYTYNSFNQSGRELPRDDIAKDIKQLLKQQSEGSEKSEQSQEERKKMREGFLDTTKNGVPKLYGKLVALAQTWRNSNATGI